MSPLQKIRLAAAIILLCGIFLPLSECARHPDQPPPTKSLGQTLFPQSDKNFDYAYAASVVKTDIWHAGIFALVALMWPFVACLLDRKVRGWRFWRVIYVLQVLLCAGTTYWLWIFTALGRWLYGTYVVFIGIGTFAVATTILLLRRSNTP